MDQNYQITISHGQKILTQPFQTLPPYEKIQELAKSSFPDATSYTVYYVDDEGDQVSVRSDMELSEAYRLAEHQGKRNVRLYLERVEEVKNRPTTNISVVSPPPQVVSSTSPLRPELSSSTFQRSQVFDFRTADESEILVKIQNKLTEMTSVVSHLAKTKQEQTEKMKHISHFENEITHLSNEKNQIEQCLEDIQLKNNNLETDLRLKIQKNNELTGQIQEMQESFSLQLKEQEDTTNRIRQEKENTQTLLKQKIISITSQEATITLLKETLSKMGKELRKEIETKSELESKVELMRKELDSKHGEYLEMSRRVIDVQAQKESLTKKATTLERQLEQEHQERENLQQSLVQLQLQGSITGGKIPFQEESRDNPEPSGIYVVKPDEKWPKEKGMDNLLEAQRWETELGVLNNIGFVDNNKNLEFLNKHQDIQSTVKAMHEETMHILPKQKVLPPDISESDIQMLEAMGFVDLNNNIQLLRSNGHDISVVVEKLLKKMN